MEVTKLWATQPEIKQIFSGVGRDRLRLLALEGFVRVDPGLNNGKKTYSVEDVDRYLKYHSAGRTQGE